MSFNYVKVDAENLLETERTFLAQGLDGDYEAIKTLLLILASAIEQGVPLTPKLALFLAKALRDISAGGNPGDAFHIKRKRGQRDTRAAAERAIACVFKVKLLLHDRPQLGLDEAFELVGNELHISFDTAKAAWRDYRHSVELSDDGSSGFFQLRKHDK